MSLPIVIVGSGLAGYMLAKELRKLDADVELVIVTASSGDFYSKPQLSTALTKQQSPEALAMKSATAMAEQLSATVMVNTVVEAIDKEGRILFLNEGRTLAYSKLVLALGAQPINLNLTGDEPSSVLIQVNNLDDYRQFSSWLDEKQRIGILGAGLVGCEFMNDLLNHGRQVSMVSLESAPLARLVPEKLGQAFQTELAAQGVKWHMSNAAKAVKSSGSEVSVMLSDGYALAVDGVLSAVGLLPQLKLAKSIGLNVNRGIVVDHYLQSSDPHVFSLGDCAEVGGQVLQYVAPLLLCARALAKTLSSEKTSVSYPPMPIVIKTPACPVVSLPPPVECQGVWQCDGVGVDWVARFVSSAGCLQGFALMGKETSQRMAMVKEMSTNN
jgi:rubredoxin---NAD+ reductase